MSETSEGYTILKHFEVFENHSQDFYGKVKKYELITYVSQSEVTAGYLLPHIPLKNQYQINIHIYIYILI